MLSDCQATKEEGERLKHSTPSHHTAGIELTKTNTPVDTYNRLPPNSPQSPSPQPPTRHRARTDFKKPSSNLSCHNVSICIFAVVVLLVVLFAPIFPSDQRAAQKCFALMLFVATLWSTEAIPLWITSLTIPLIAIWGNITLDSENNPIPAAISAKKLLKDLMDPTVVLIMGGFTVAHALHKYQLDIRLAVAVLSRASSSFRKFLLMVMLLGAFLSMWVSNVASPVLMVFLISPILPNMEKNAAKSVVLGIAFSCNVGGMLTPIASPQNIVAIQYLDKVGVSINFIHWIGSALPVCCIALIFLWFWILVAFQPGNGAVPQIEITEKRRFSWQHWYVIAVAVITVTLWCLFELIKPAFGHLGVVGLIPVVALYGTGVLEKDDFKSLDWHILMLLGGGVVLGEAVESSRLLEIITEHLTEGFLKDQHIWVVYAVINACIIVITNFISHTVAAITMLQVVAEVGVKLGHPTILVLGGALCCSASCALPVSSFPNVICYSVKGKNEQNVLAVRDYLTNGIVSQIVFYVLMLTVGFFTFRLFGF